MKPMVETCGGMSGVERGEEKSKRDGSNPHTQAGRQLWKQQSIEKHFPRREMTASPRGYVSSAS